MIRKSIECWILSEDQGDVLLLTVPKKEGKRPEFSQPVTGGINENETPKEACIREIFEETGKKINSKFLLKIEDNIIVKIDDTLSVHKTLFACNTEVFTPTLSPREHIGYRWVKPDDVENNLFYQSNKDTWKLVHAHLSVRARSDR